MHEYIGITRSIDDLGRVVIPKEIRRQFRLDSGDKLEIKATESGQIILNPILGNKCSACSEQGLELKRLGNVYVCPECLIALRKMNV